MYNNNIIVVLKADFAAPITLSCVIISSFVMLENQTSHEIFVFMKTTQISAHMFGRVLPMYPDVVFPQATVACPHTPCIRRWLLSGVCYIKDSIGQELPSIEGGTRNTIDATVISCNRRPAPCTP